jgi:hypothetical protein
MGPYRCPGLAAYEDVMRQKTEKEGYVRLNKSNGLRQFNGVH